MDSKQLLFKIVSINPALLTTLVFIYLTHHQWKRNKPLDSDTFDYDQHDYIISPDCSPEYDGFCLNDGFCFFTADTNEVACIFAYSYKGRRCQKYMW